MVIAPKGIDDALSAGSKIKHEIVPATGESGLRLAPVRCAPSLPKLDPKALRGLAGKIVETIRPHTEADDAALLLSVLTIFGCLVGRSPFLMVDGAQHCARLFGLIVGETAKGRKSTAMKQTLAFFEVSFSEFLKNRRLGGFGSGEALADAVQGPLGEDGKKTGSDGRLLVLENEFARVLTACNRDGSTLSAVLRESWDGDKVQVRSRNKTTVVEDPHVSALAAITMEELKRLLTATDTANGFANRFLFVLAKRSKLLPNGGEVPENEITRLGMLISRAVVQANQVRTLAKTQSGDARWAELYAEMAVDVPDGIVGALVARAEPQVLRLAITYALLDCSPSIDACHFDAAYAFWQYCRESVQVIFGKATGDPIRDKILSAITDAGNDGLSRQALSASLGRNVSAAHIDRVVIALEATRTIRAASTNHGRGRPAVTYFLNEEIRSNSESAPTSDEEIRIYEASSPPVPITSCTSLLRKHPDDGFSLGKPSEPQLYEETRSKSTEELPFGEAPERDVEEW
jgi:hypothetical protein